MVKQLRFFGIESSLATNEHKNSGKYVLDQIDQEGFQLENFDIIIVASKVISIIEGNQCHFESIKEVREETKIFSKRSGLDPRFVEMIFREADQVIGAVKGAVLALKDGSLQANAGVDNSNSGGKNYLITLPKNSIRAAIEIKNYIQEKKGISIGVIISDSKTHPLRRGTSGFTLGCAGFIPVIDDKGQPDLYGYIMNVTSRALADNLVCGAEILMGETSESTPIIVVRGVEQIFFTDQDPYELNKTMKMEKERCIYMGPLFEQLKERGDKTG